jgi:hypothetical protein
MQGLQYEVENSADPGIGIAIDVDYNGYPIIVNQKGYIQLRDYTQAVEKWNIVKSPDPTF